MDKIVNIHEVKTHLSRIVDEVAAGAEVIIAKARQPMARLTQLMATRGPKKLGPAQRQDQSSRAFQYVPA